MPAPDAPLHPRRIQDALEWLAERDPNFIHDVGMDAVESAQAALKMIQKAQRATGLTPEVADVGSHVLGVLDYVKKGLTRK